MKTINKIQYLFIVVVAITLTSCSKDFLDEMPTKEVAKEKMTDVAKYNPKAIEGKVPGIYSLTFKYEVGDWGGHTDFGHKSFDIVSDILCTDMTQRDKAYNKYVGVSDLSGLLKTAGEANQAWSYFYKIIKAANENIDMFEDKIPELPKSKAIFGQVKALRAYAYLYLVNFYQKPYLEDKEAKSVVLLTKDDGISKGLSTVAEVYDVIITDLEMAIESLADFERANKSSINSDVARGLLVYAYLFTGQYDKAEKVAGEVIDSKHFTIMSKDEVLNSGFNSVDISGWMWGIDLTTDNSPLLPTFWGMMDIYTYSYQFVTQAWSINENLYDAIPSTDVRKKQFQCTKEDSAQFDDAKVQVPYLLPIHKFFNKNRKIALQDWTSDEVYMRVAEMYLAKAEAQARQGKDADAKATLLELVDKRDDDASGRIDPLSGQTLLDEIYFQWRVEMWGEGKAFWAMKRFQKVNKRDGSSFNYPNVEFKYNDDRLYFEIPEDERNANPNIK